uniref:Uncharacterized protein n=1 Tax=Anguilla anguilla TaxID=7936 RepID=A0A0E9TJ77_ANGAN
MQGVSRIYFAVLCLSISSLRDV